jgi:DNA-binding transcriptional regulator YiaG
MITRKTLRQVNAQKGHFDAEKFESLTDADIDRMIAEDPELAPPTQSLAPLLEMRDIRRRLGLTQAQLAKTSDATGRRCPNTDIRRSR